MTAAKCKAKNPENCRYHTNTRSVLYVNNLAAAAVPRHIDESYASYYKATDKKHFGDPTEPGSKFLDPKLKQLEDVLKLRIHQSPTLNLDGDDKEKLIQLGADPDGFLRNNRYLLVHTKGKVGVVHSDKLNPDQKVLVKRTKPGVPCSLIVEVNSQPETDYAVIIMAKNDKTGKDFAITAFPGLVTKPVDHPNIDALEGNHITVAEAKTILGESFWLNTSLKAQSS